MNTTTQESLAAALLQGTALRAGAQAKAREAKATLEAAEAARWAAAAKAPQSGTAPRTRKLSRKARRRNAAKGKGNDAKGKAQLQAQTAAAAAPADGAQPARLVRTVMGRTGLPWAMAEAVLMSCPCLGRSAVSVAEREPRPVFGTARVVRTQGATGTWPRGTWVQLLANACRLCGPVCTCRDAETGRVLGWLPDDARLAGGDGRALARAGAVSVQILRVCRARDQVGGGKAPGKGKGADQGWSGLELRETPTCPTCGGEGHRKLDPICAAAKAATAAKVAAKAAAPVTEATKATKAGWAAGAACRAHDVRNARKALLAPPSFLEWVDPSKFTGKKGHRALGTARALAQGAGGGEGVGGGGGASSPDLSLRSCPSLSAGADAAFAEAAAEEQAGFPTALGCGDAVEAAEAVEAVEAVETKEEVAEATALPASPRRAVRGQGEAGEAAPTKAAPTKAAATVACQPVAKVAKATEQSVEKPAKLALLLDLFFKGVLNATEFAEQKAIFAA